MRRNALVCVAFLALAGVHVGVPISMLAGRAAILANGSEIRLGLTTQDPRSLFRGEYSNLNYTIGTLRDVPTTDEERQRCAQASPNCSAGSSVELYVLLDRGDDGLYRASAVSLTRPAGGLFIRGKIRYGSVQTRQDAKCPSGRCFSGQVTYGIETWFGPQGVPAQVDRASRSEVVAVVRVDPGGAAVLSALLINGEPVGIR